MEPVGPLDDEDEDGDGEGAVGIGGSGGRPLGRPGEGPPTSDVVPSGWDDVAAFRRLSARVLGPPHFGDTG
jgi:hypothetical protein